MRPRILAALGVFLVAAAVYIATAPGRIDIIDGQYRFEVARNIVESGSTQVHDPFLGYAVRGVLGTYSPYGISGSLTAAPLVALANLTGEPSQNRQQFFFSLTSPLLGAASMAVLFVFMTALGVAPFHAIWWTAVAAFATLVFPVATSTFDQTQHGFFLLCACGLAFLSARRESRGLAAGAGLLLAFLVNFQQTYAIVLPTVAIAALAPPGVSREAQRRGFERAGVVLFAGAAGVLVWMGINSFRYGSILHTVQMNVAHPPALGNPLIGLPGLLVSPGKSIFLYSPPSILALFGLRRLWAIERRLTEAILATSCAYVGMVSALTFYGGDWCWGPRYFVTVLPLVSLAFPFVRVATRRARALAGALVAVGLVVQVLALAVDHQRFFFERSLPTFFWYTMPGYYFTHSALFARPGEVIDLLTHDVPPEADLFRPGPYSAQPTYAVFGGWGHPELTAPMWMRHYQVFWLPRPWPFWMTHVPVEQRPVDPRAAEMVVGGTALLGAILLLAARPRLRHA
jgi:hypothetical protein